MELLYRVSSVQESNRFPDELGEGKRFTHEERKRKNRSLETLNY